MISIIVPVYKVEQYLSQCLDSIVNQTFKDLEIILVDDGSPDRCGMICDEYARKDKRIQVYHIEFSGLSAARNYGMTRARGEFLGFVDSDDWLEPNMFETLFQQMEEHGSDVAICSFYYDYLDQTIAATVVDEQFYNNRDLLLALLSGKLGSMVWNKLYKISSFKRILFPESRVLEDIATLYKVFVNTATAVSISKPLYHYRIRKGSISQIHSLKYLIDCWIAYKERFEFFLQKNEYKDDQELVDVLHYGCALAIAKTWRWVYGCQIRESTFYWSYIDEMCLFSREYLPWFGKEKWPFFLRLSCFLSKFKIPFIFATLYCMNQVFRRISKKAI